MLKQVVKLNSGGGTECSTAWRRNPRQRGVDTLVESLVIMSESDYFVAFS